MLKSYWTDYDGHESGYAPAFFINDIQRLWRTFCVNYEARTKRLSSERKMERRVKNLKLKYSRMLTCYSAIIFLLHVFRTNSTVNPEDTRSMSYMTPTMRLKHVVDDGTPEKVGSAVAELLARYDSFLLETNKPDSELINHMKANFERMRKEAHDFGDLMFQVVEAAGGGSRLYRMTVV